MSFIFSIGTILIAFIIAHVNCCSITEPKTERKTILMSKQPTHNCTIGDLYVRTPTAKNNYTSFWCIFMRVKAVPFPVDNPLDECKTSDKSAVVTIPENEEELASIHQRSKSYFDSHGGTVSTWTLMIDGNLKPSCSPIDTCSPSTSFETTNTQTDPTFIMNHWKRGQPDNSFFNGTQKACLGIDNDGYLRNVFCAGQSSSDYTMFGVICGISANSYISPRIE